MGRVYLEPDRFIPFGNHRKSESDDQDARLKEIVHQLSRLFGITHEKRYNRVWARYRFKPQLVEPVSELGRLLLETGKQRSSFVAVANIECCCCGCAVGNA